MRIKIIENNYEYREDKDVFMAAQPVYVMPLIVDAAEALITLQKSWEEKADAGKDGLLRYADALYPIGILLGIEGMPMGVVRGLDDTIQFIPFKQERIQ